MRARNLKPSIFKHELLATSNPLYTWVFEGLWCMADREGRLEDRPRRIHLEINAGRAFEGTEESLNWLSENGFIIRYKHGDGAFIQVVNFRKHQNPHIKEPASALPEYVASPVQAPDKHRTRTSPARLIPSSLIPDSGFPLPESPSPISDRASAKPEPVVEPDGFADIRRAYPKRAGSHRWQDAITAYRARLKEGVTPDEILAGVERYAAYVRADGKEGTEYVQQAATFIGKNRGYTEPWRPSPKVVNLSPVERVRLAAEKAKNGTVVNEQSDGSVGNPFGDLRGEVSTGVRRLTASAVGVSDWEPEGF